MSYIFISYSRKNSDIVDSFAGRLRTAGYEIWLDRSGSGTGIPFSTKWFEVIKEALYLSAGAIIFKSEYWLASGPCSEEFSLIKSCSMPYLELDPADVSSDPDAAFAKFRQFFINQVQTSENANRTSLFSHAYELKSGVDPYQLIEHPGGLGASLRYLAVDLPQLTARMTKERYDKLCPELYDYMLKYLGFAKKITRGRIAKRLLGFLIAAASLVLLLSVPLALAQGSKENWETYAGQALSGKIASLRNIDPVAAINTAESMDDSYLSVTSYYSLSMNAVRLLDARLPDRVLCADDSDYSAFSAASTVSSSPLFDLKLSGTSGSLIFTDLSSGVCRTLNTPSPVDHFAWSTDGKMLLFSAGSRIYLCSPGKRLAPIQLSENFEPVRELKFVESDGLTYAAALTEHDTLLMWESPFPEKLSSRRDINYGIFLDDDTVVYTDGSDIIIREADTETVFTPYPDRTIKSPSWSVSDDGKKIAVLAEGDSDTLISVISLTDGSVCTEVQPAVTATALAFSDDGRSLYASAFGCGIMCIDTASGEVACGTEEMYFQNIARYGKRWVLIDYNGAAVIFDSQLQKILDAGSINQVFMPAFSLAVNADAGYLYTANRGGASTFGCSRFNLNTGEINLFIVPRLSKIDSNTAVGLSDDGAFVAFGYPDGTVRVYEQEHMYLVYERRCAAESVSALKFSADNTTIRVLGESGNIYSAELPLYELMTGDASAAANWAAMKEQLTDLRDTYYDGISPLFREQS